MKAVDQLTIKQVHRLKDKSKKIMFNYNNKLRDKYKYTQRNKVRNNEKSINVKGERKNCSNFKMCSNLHEHQLKIDGYEQRLVYMKQMVTTNLKSIRNIQEIKRKEHKCNTIESINTQEKRVRE